MSPLDAFWHLGNFILPAWFVAGVVAALMKLLWRAELKGRSWRQLWLWGGAGGALGLLALDGRQVLPGRCAGRGQGWRWGVGGRRRRGRGTGRQHQGGQQRSPAAEGWRRHGDDSGLLT